MLHLVIFTWFFVKLAAATKKKAYGSVYALPLFDTSATEFTLYMLDKLQNVSNSRPAITIYV